MHIGLDFDGTTVVYGRVFHRYATELFGLPATVPAAKNAIRDFFWSRPEGKDQWIELQGIVYGLKMKEAELAPGLDPFLRRCKELGIPLSVISHKTVHAARGPQINLRAAARDWLVDRNFFSPQGYGLRRERVFFEATRQDKIARISSEGCTHFVDDLAEVFAEPTFPASVVRILYGVDRPPPDLPPDIKVFANWTGITKHLLPEAAWKRT